MASTVLHSFADFPNLLAKHLGDLGDDLNSYEAELVMRACSKVESPLSIWNPTSEQENVDRVRHHLGELVIAIDGMHPKVRAAMNLKAAYEMIENESSAHDLLVLLKDAVTTLAEPLHSASAVAVSGIPARSNFNFEAVSVIDACRQAWKRRRRAEAPRSINDTGPFDAFVRDVFQSLGLESEPRSAMNAWRAIQARKSAKS